MLSSHVHIFPGIQGGHSDNSRDFEGNSAADSCVPCDNDDLSIRYTVHVVAFSVQSFRIANTSAAFRMPTLVAFAMEASYIPRQSPRDFGVGLCPPRRGFLRHAHSSFAPISTGPKPRYGPEAMIGFSNIYMSPLQSAPRRYRSSSLAFTHPPFLVFLSSSALPAIGSLGSRFNWSVVAD